MSLPDRQMYPRWQSFSTWEITRVSTPPTSLSGQDSKSWQEKIVIGTSLNIFYVKVKLYEQKRILQPRRWHQVRRSTFQNHTACSQTLQWAWSAPPCRNTFLRARAVTRAAIGSVTQLHLHVQLQHQLHSYFYTCSYRGRNSKFSSVMFLDLMKNYSYQCHELTWWNATVWTW